MDEKLHQDPHGMEKLLLTGALAAQSKLKKEPYSYKRSRLFKAYHEVQKGDQLLQKHLENPPQALQGVSKEIQEGLFLNVYRFYLLTGKSLPSSLNKDLLNHLTHMAPHEKDPHIIQEMIDHSLH